MLDAVTEKPPKVAEHLDAARADALAFPKEIPGQIWSINSQDRLTREIARGTYVVGIFPNRNAPVRVVAAVLAEHHDEYAERRGYLGLDVLAGSRTTLVEGALPDTT